MHSIKENISQSISLLPLLVAYGLYFFHNQIDVKYSSFFPLVFFGMIIIQLKTIKLTSGKTLTDNLIFWIELILVLAQQLYFIVLYGTGNLDFAILVSPWIDCFSEANLFLATIVIIGCLINCSKKKNTPPCLLAL